MSSNVHLQHVLSTIHVVTNMSILTEGFVNFLYFFQVFLRNTQMQRNWVSCVSLVKFDKLLDLHYYVVC